MEYMEARMQDLYDSFEAACDVAYENGLKAFEEDGQSAINPYAGESVEIWKSWEFGWLAGYKSPPSKDKGE